MEFARAELAKYGWTEGKGLGARESGITKALKPTLKFDQCGIGHENEEFKFQWWDHVYNKAVNNISVNTLENGGVELKREKDLVVTTKIPSKANNKKITHGAFVSGGTLIGSTEISSTVVSDSSDSEDEVRHDLLTTLSDDQLFKICGGLTAHKGARHGINMTAKLARIQSQDEKHSGNLITETLSTKKKSTLDVRLDDEKKARRKKKRDKKKKRLRECDDNLTSKKRKSVTFAECMENILEFVSHRRIISKGKKRLLENCDVELEANGVEECIEKKKKKRKHKGEKECEDAETDSFAGANDSLVSLFSKKKKSKRKEKSDLVDFISNDVTEKEKEYVCDKKKKKKRKLQEEQLENDCDDIFLPAKKIKKDKKMKIDVLNETNEVVNGEQVTEDTLILKKKKKKKKKKEMVTSE